MAPHPSVATRRWTPALVRSTLAYGVTQLPTQPAKSTVHPQGAVAIVVATQVLVLTESGRVLRAHQGCQPASQTLLHQVDLVQQPPGEQRAAAVRGALIHAWKSYERYALGSDELHPVSKSAKQSILGGMGVPGASVTIVDALSTLHLLRDSETNLAGVPRCMPCTS